MYGVLVTLFMGGIGIKLLHNAMVVASIMRNIEVYRYDKGNIDII